MSLEITLGPLLFNWAPEDIAGFYERMSREPLVRRVYLGEVVCGKREPLAAATLLAAADVLHDAGKEVVWSTLGLIATPRDRRLLQGITQQDEPPLLELNDIAALSLLPAGRSFVAGPLLNIYNGSAARFLVDRGCERLCPNIELSLAAIGDIHRACPDLQIELFGFGRLPLALSARCHHARQAGLSKDTCRFVCDRDPDGQAVATIEGEPFLSINGIQTLSHGVHTLSASPDDLQAAGVSAVRLSPHLCDMSAAIAAYGRYFETGNRERLLAQLRACDLPGPLVDGYLEGAAGMRLAAAL